MHVILTVPLDQEGEFCHMANSDSRPGSNLTSIALTESAICKPPVWFFGRFSIGRERYDTQPLEGLHLEVQAGRASAAKPVMHGLAFRLLVEGI